MHSTIVRSSLALCWLLAACAATPGSEPSPSPKLGVDGPGGEPGAGDHGGGNGTGPSAGPGGAPGAGGPGGAGGAGGAGGGSTVTREWSETVEVTNGDVHSLIHQEYKAVASVSLVGGDGAWTFTGTANITAAFTSDYQARLADILGAPCNVHYTDAASASGSVQVEGGLSAADGFYDFTLYIPGIDTGTNATVRDDSDCDGPNNSETTPWSAAPISAGGSGEYSGASISGSEAVPREGGEDRTEWSFSIPN